MKITDLSEHALAHNDPGAFDRLLPEEQAALRMWVRLALQPAKTYTDSNSRWHSYNLKHHAEAALGWYVGNGSMKGAMLAEGYEQPPLPPLPQYEINWRFKTEPRCHHRIGQTVAFTYVDSHGKTRKVMERGLNCPAALAVNSMYRRQESYAGGTYDIVTLTYPALCAATPDELAEFHRLRLAGREALDRRHAEYVAAHPDEYALPENVVQFRPRQEV